MQTGTDEGVKRGWERPEISVRQKMGAEISGFSRLNKMQGRGETAQVIRFIVCYQKMERPLPAGI